MRPVWLVALLAALVAACSGQGSSIPVTGKVVLEGEADHSGVLVSLAGRSALTDKEGAWTVELLSGGSYVLQVSASGTLEGMRAVPVEVPEEGALSVPEVKLTPVGEVEGEATLGSSTGNAGLTVLAPGSSAVAVTDDSGRYVLRGVPAGNRTVDVVAPGFARSSFQVQVRRDARVSASPVVLGRARTTPLLSAKMLGASGHSGIVATLVGTEFSATTAADGSFTFRGVPDGVYSLSLRSGSQEELVPGVVFLQGVAYLSEGVSLVPLPPLALSQAKRLASATLVGVPQSWESYTPQQFIQRSVDGGRFLFLSDTSYQLLMEERSSFIRGVLFEGTLRVASTTGGAPLVLGSGVTAFTFSPDGASALFTRGDGSLLFANLATGEVFPLAPAVYFPSRYLTAYGFNPLYLFGASPDGSKVAYLKDSVLYVVGSTGGASMTLGPASSSGSGRVEPGVFSADGNRLFFYSSGNGLSLADLKTGTSQALTSSLSSYRVTPDRSIAVALGGSKDNNTLFVSRLNPSSVTTTPVEASISEFMMSPDGARVVYKSTATPGTARLLTLPSTSPTLLSSLAYDLLQFSADGRQFVMVERDATTGTYSLLNVDLTVPTTGKWSLWSGSSTPSSVQYSGNGAWVVFSVGTSYYAVGSKGVGLRSLATTSSYFIKTVLSPTHDRMFLLADVTGASRTLQSVPFAPGAGVTLASGVSDFAVTADGSRVIYHTGSGSLRSVAPTGGSDTVLAEGVRSFSLSPDGAWVLFVDAGAVARVLKLATGEVRVLAEQVARASWSGSEVVLVREGALAPLRFQDGLYLTPIN
jgi:hypothetical protein